MHEELLRLAREVLNCHFSKKKLEILPEIKKKYSKEQACFVTLTENGELRGCIGSLYPHQALWEDVVDNTINAGLHDFRFLPLDISDLPKIKIEVSVLSAPETLKYSSERDLLDKIDRKMGIILKKSGACSTFLPQVWEQIPNKIVFMEQLALKAGLAKNEWKDSDIYFYRVEKVKES